MSASGPRDALTRDVAGIRMDLDGVEQLTDLVMGGADTNTVDDPSGTGLQRFDVDLSVQNGAGAGAP